METLAVPPTTVQIPVAAEAAGNTPILLQSFTIRVAGKLHDLPQTVLLGPQSLDPRLRCSGWGAARRLSLPPATTLNIDVSDLELSEGDSLPLTVSAQGSAAGRTVAASVKVNYRVLALPRLDGWHGGDGHVHSSWSPDVFLIPVDNRARFAADNGFSFLIMTDHEDGIATNGPRQTGTLPAAMPPATGGALRLPRELKSPALDGEATAWPSDMSETAASVPSNRSLPPAQLIEAINNHRPPHSHAIIAHPYGRPSWLDWSVSGFSGLELLSQERAAKPATIDRWFSLLNSGLDETLHTGRFVVEIGTSDCHNFQAPGFRGFSWIYLGSRIAANRTTIWDAFRRGRVSASGMKDLGVFLVNDMVQGSMVTVSFGSELQFRLLQRPVTGRKCTAITVYNKERVAVHQVTDPAATVTIRRWAPVASDLYVVRFAFAAISGGSPSEVWTNPVFVRVR